MKVIACEPYPDTAFCEKWGVELVSMDDLLSRVGGRRLAYKPLTRRDEAPVSSAS